MFWGLIMEANKRYSQTVAKTFHMSMACLDVSQSTSDDAVQVMCSTEGTTYLICNLNRKGMSQTPLDLNFQQGSKIEFVCNGKGSVHLTGYVMEDLDEFDDEEADDEEVDDEEVDDEEVEDEEISQHILKSLKALKNQKRKGPEDKSKVAKKVKLDEEADEDDSDDESDAEEMDETIISEDSDMDDSENVEDEDDESDEEEEVTPKKQKQQKKQPEQPKNKKQEKSKMNGSVESPLEKNKNKKQKNAQEPMKKGEQNQEQKKKGEQNQEQKKKGEQNQEQKKKGEQNQVAKRTVEGGVQIEDIRAGNGAPAKPGKMVSVYYIGKLQKNGKKFDATQQGEGFKFRLGKGEVIKGWDVGISGMKIGGKRKITIPAHMAYGNKGSPPQIPGNSTLVFEVELKNVF